MKLIKTHITLITVLIISILTNAISLAESVDFDIILNKAIDYSYDVKIANVDVGISQADLKIAKSEYYPNLSFIYDTEYVKDLNDPTNQVSSVGSTFINQVTQFQNLLAFKVNYTLLDYGIRNHKSLLALKDVSLKQILLQRNLRDLKIKMARLYTEALLNYTEIKSNEQLLPIYKELFKSKERLFVAGTSPKLNVMDEAVKIARTQDTIESTKTKLNDSLQNISVYTNQKYNPSNIELKNYGEETYTPTVDSNGVHFFKQRIEKKRYTINNIRQEETLEYKSYQLEVEKKKHELEVLKRERLPTFSLYTNYIFYGTNGDNPLKAISNIGSRNVTVGISAMLPILDGLKNAASREKAQLEIKKLELEKEKYSHEALSQFAKLQEQYNLYQNELLAKEELQSKWLDKIHALDRLTQNKIVDTTELLNCKAEILKENIELEKLKINLLSTLKQLEILSEDY